MIRIEYYVNGEPALNNKKIAALEREYDEKNAVAVERYYGLDGSRVRNSDGYSRIDRTWLDNDHVLTQAWFDENDEPVTAGNTYYSFVREYDSWKNMVSEKYLDASGALIARNEGYDEIRQTFDE